MYYLTSSAAHRDLIKLIFTANLVFSYDLSPRYMLDFNFFFEPFKSMNCSIEYSVSLGVNTLVEVPVPEFPSFLTFT